MKHDLFQPAQAGLRDFCRDTSGAGSAFSILAATLFMMMIGVAVDNANGWRLQNRLQVAADAAALAASAKLPDVSAARSLALEVARRNLGDDYADSITANDIEFLRWEEGTTTPTTGDDANAVVVNARMDKARGNGIDTFFLRLVGIDQLATAAVSTAVGSTETGSGTALGCEDAMILTSAYMDIGGGNKLVGDICLHGKTGLHTGGGDYYAGGVQLSAASASAVVVNYTIPGSATADQVRRASDLEPVIVPKLQSMFDALWAALSIKNANGKDLVVDGYYTGNLLPDFLKDNQGRIAIVYVDQGWWTAQPGQLKPNTVYLVNHGMQIAGDVQAQKVGIIAKGQIGVGGGTNLHYTDDFFFSTESINTGGNISWGDAGTYCATGRYSVYTFSVNGTVSLGGWGGGAGAHGLFGAAKTFSPGGAMKNSGGLYFEAANYTALGGALDIKGCGVRLQSYYEQALPAAAATVRKAGGRLVN